MNGIEGAGRDQDNAMVNDRGDWFYADNADDAMIFWTGHEARPAYPERFLAMFPELVETFGASG